MKIRIGFGYDVHRLENGLPLHLGGIRIHSEKGAVAHSDGDVLIHALCDALLGAAGLRDIGHHFPDTSGKYKGINSKELLKEVMKLISRKNFFVVNADITICLEQPKINPHIEAMKKALAPLLEISEEDISIKATTNEKMGFIGNGEGIGAYAVALIQSK